MIAVLTKDQHAILNTCDGAPPLLWLNYCETEDQKQHWQRVKTFFQGLHDELKAYFSGQSSNANSKDPVQKHFLLWRDYYLAFYGVVQVSWAIIQQEAEKEGFDLTASSPSECLIGVLERHCETFFQICLSPYEEWSLRKIYDTHRKGRELKKLLEKPQEEWTQPEKQSYKKYRQAVSQGMENYSPELLIFCLAVSEKEAKKNKYLRGKLNQFWSAHADIQKLYRSELHPSKQRQSFAWKQGNILQASKQGGIYA